jgi:ribosomal protein S27AE
MNKTCKKCGETKDLSQFYKHRAMADGHLNICISCKVLDAKEYRMKNIEKVKEYDRTRGRTEERKEKRNEYLGRLKTSNPAKYKTMRREAIKKDRNKIRNKNHARVQLENAIRAGKIIRPNFCTSCGSNARIEAHHRDYDKPFDVVWLCRKCHGMEHRQ